MKQALLGLAALAAIIGTVMIGQSYQNSRTALVGNTPAAAQAQQAALPIGEGFDFYVLALSWSPTYCADTEAARRDQSQCGGARPYAFVVHGLWPQYEAGYPRSCRTTQAGPDRREVQAMLDIMPSPRLVQIQWERHGTCSGLSARDYFQVAREAAQSVQIPSAYRTLPRWQTFSVSEIENAFIEANPNLQSDGIAVERSRNLLREVRICLTKTLEPRPCPEVDQGGEPGTTRLAMPPLRGGSR